MKTKEEIIKLVESEDVEFIRLQFTDMFGILKNVAITAGQLRNVLDNRYSFEASYLFGDFMDGDDDEELYLHPDFDTFVILPWRPQQGKVARMLCDVCDETGEKCQFSSRTVLSNVVEEAKKKGYTFYVDPEIEFFLFHTDENGVPTTVTHEQAGYMDVAPMDLGENARRDIVLSLEEMNFEVESSHHEKAPAQHEIDFKEAEALKTADSIVTFKTAVRSVSKRFGLNATFMPKPKEGVPGSGMHLKFSVYKDGKNIFNNLKDVYEATDEAKWFIGGIMEHMQALCAITNPTVNSYKRLSSGFGAPQLVSWARKGRNTSIKLKIKSGMDTKVELRFPDPSANPYLAIAACIVAGMEGIEKHTDPGAEAPFCYEIGNIRELPEALRVAMDYLKEDTLLNNMLGVEFAKLYTEAKMAEWDEYMLQVSDWEIEKYLSRI